MSSQFIFQRTLTKEEDQKSLEYKHGLFFLNVNPNQINKSYKKINFSKAESKKRKDEKRISKIDTHTHPYT